MLEDMVDTELVVSHTGPFASSEVVPRGTVMVLDTNADTSFSLLF